MLALIGNLHIMELLVIVLGALMIFGKRLPEVAVRGAAQLVRLRRSVSKMWREAGLEEELRKVRRDIERETPRIQAPRIPSVRDLVKGDPHEGIPDEDASSGDPTSRFDDGAGYSASPDEPAEEARRQGDETPGDETPVAVPSSDEDDDEPVPGEPRGDESGDQEPGEDDAPADTKESA